MPIAKGLTRVYLLTAGSPGANQLIMATTLPTASRNAAADVIVDKVDQGSGAGKVRIKSAGATVIAEVTLGDPAFGAAATGVATGSGLPKVGAGIAAAGAGTDAASFDVCDSDNTVIWSGGIAELGLDNVNIADGQVVNINTLTYTQPAST